MRDAIARALTRVLALLPWTRRPDPGRHTAAHFAAQPAPTPEPASVNPWARPWTGPTKEEAAEFFRQRAETTLELHTIRERRRAAAFATMGVDYPYAYDGAPFPESAFAIEGGAA